MEASLVPDNPFDRDELVADLFSVLRSTLRQVDTTGATRFLVCRDGGFRVVREPPEEVGFYLRCEPSREPLLYELTTEGRHLAREWDGAGQSISPVRRQAS